MKRDAPRSVGRSVGRSIDRSTGAALNEHLRTPRERNASPREPRCPKDPLAINQRSCPSTCQRRNNASSENRNRFLRFPFMMPSFLGRHRAILPATRVGGPRTSPRGLRKRSLVSPFSSAIPIALLLVNRSESSIEKIRT